MSATVLTFYDAAARERVSRVARRAAANRTVIDNLANGRYAASPWAGISAFLIRAGPIQRTFRTGDALGSAVRRGTDEIRHARANGLSVHLPALTVRSARRGSTHVYDYDVF